MISELLIEALKRKKHKFTDQGLDLGRPVPMDFSIWLDDLVDYNIFICDVRVLHQMLCILPHLPYMDELKPEKSLYDGDMYTGFDVWYPEPKRITFAPCISLCNEYWALRVIYEGDIVTDVVGTPHHVTGVTSDY